MLAMVIELFVDMTDDDIREIIRNSLPVATAKQQGFCLMIGGYDDDKRELWDIPEAVSLFKRLVSLGFISCLEVSTKIEILARVSGLPGFGAFEVWASSIGKMGFSESFSQEEMKEFLAALDRSNSVAMATLMTVGKPETTKKTQMSDGQVRHKGFNIPTWKRELGR